MWSVVGWCSDPLRGPCSLLSSKPKPSYSATLYTTRSHRKAKCLVPTADMILTAFFPSPALHITLLLPPIPAHPQTAVLPIASPSASPPYFSTSLPSLRSRAVGRAVRRRGGAFASSSEPSEQGRGLLEGYLNALDVRGESEATGGRVERII